MAKCRDITFNKKKLCIGSLDRKVGIYNRKASGKSNASAAHSEAYTLFKSVFAGIETKSQGTFQTLDGVSLEADLIITHTFAIRYLAGVSSEQFIQYKGYNYKILKAENIDEADEWWRLKANQRGLITKAGAQ